MVYVILVIVGITVIITWSLTRNILKAKHQKEMNDLAVKNKVKSEKKEEVIKNANKQKAQINTGDPSTDFNNTINIVHNLSQKRD